MGWDKNGPLEESRRHGAVAGGRNRAEEDAALHVAGVLLQHLHEDGAPKASFVCVLRFGLGRRRQR